VNIAPKNQWGAPAIDASPSAVDTEKKSVYPFQTEEYQDEES